MKIVRQCRDSARFSGAGSVPSIPDLSEKRLIFRDKRGRGGNEEADYPQGRELVRLHEAACTVGARDVVRDGMTGPEIGAAVQAARVAAVHRARQTGG